eukprot:Rmarinus@m.13191
MGAGASSHQPGQQPATNSQSTEMAVDRLTNPNAFWDESPEMIKVFYQIYKQGTMEKLTVKKYIEAPASDLLPFLLWKPDIVGLKAKKKDLILRGRLEDQCKERCISGESIDFLAVYRWRMKSKHIQKWCEFIFDQYDRNRDGTIDSHELVEVLSSLEGGRAPPEYRVRQVHTMIDSDLDGKISRQELMAWYMSLDAENPTDELSAQLERSRTRQAQLENEVSDLQTQLEKKSALIQQFQSQDTVVKELLEYKEIVDRIRSENTSLYSEVKKRDAALDAAKTDLDHELDAARQSHQQLQKTVEELRAQLRERDDEAEKQRAESRILKQEAAERAKRIAELKSMNARLQGREEIIKLQDELETLKSQAMRDREEILSLSQGREFVTDEVKGYQSKLDDLTQEMIRAKDEAAQAREEADLLRSEIDRMRREHQNAAETAARVQIENDDLKEEILTRKEAMGRLRDELIRVRSSSPNLNASFDSRQPPTSPHYGSDISLMSPSHLPSKRSVETPSTPQPNGPSTTLAAAASPAPPSPGGGGGGGGGDDTREWV